MVTPEELLEHSQELYKQGAKDEASNRNIARNAYYALYHKLLSSTYVSDIEDGDTEEADNSGVHERLINKLRMSKNEHVRYLALELSSLKKTRVKADYKLQLKFSFGEAYKALRVAEKTFKNLYPEENNQQPDITESESIISDDNTLGKKSPTLKVIK
ncbi:hypothetical protein [Vibrio fluvialis]|uniref:hypothetical protein n=1 Tax=Vibrio fluvialis TaxID=676 RepID=UPI001F32BD74|nr:hypothetical protein [Vibrio fluvialis]EKO3494139.1 hypothetical protein [Vibrio fluvialis]MCE7595382.1 hypothetical protein [Vibrio fluvialis]MCE7641369.1 hypothetical protein [Vibrio fluvialis]